MKQDVFWVDAFSAEPFGGNPAVVCVGIDDLSDTQLQHLANEFNVSESVFISGAYISSSQGEREEGVL